MYFSVNWPNLVDRLLLLLVDGDIQFVLETVLIILFILECYFQFSFLLCQHSVPHVGLNF